MKISGPGQSSLLLLKVINLLNKWRVPYAIVGAFAASFYGVVRASLDADAVISLGDDEEKLTPFLSALEKAGLKTVLTRGDSRDPIRCVINIEDKFRNRVDLLIGISGMTEDVFGRARTASFLRAKIKLIGIEDFIAMKIFAGGAKDIDDVLGALRVSSDKLDLPLLKRLTLHYGKKELKKLEEILKNSGHER